MTDFTQGIIAITMAIMILSIFFWIGSSIRSGIARMFKKPIVLKPIDVGNYVKIETKNGHIYGPLKFCGVVEINEKMPFSFHGMLVLQKGDGSNIYVKHEFVRVVECVKENAT